MARGAVVLAAGRGERLWPLTSTRPKPLLPLPGGETLLTRLLRQLRGLADVAVVVAPPGPMQGLYREALRGFEPWARLVEQPRPRGTGDAALHGLRGLPRSVDEAIIVNGDLLVERAMLEALAGAGAPAAAAVRSQRPWEYGVVEVDERGCIRALREKPPDAPPGSLVNAGVYLVPRARFEELLEGLAPSPRGEVEITDAVAALARETCFRVVAGEWLWMDVGRPWELVDAYTAVLREKLGARDEPLVKGEVEPGAVLRGPVYVAPGGVVRSGTVVEGPAWVEGEAGPLARLRPGSFILRGGYAGSHTEIKASVIMEGARAPHLNYVGDSVLGEHSNLGAGTVTANLRFDHATVKVRLKGRLVDTGRRKLGAFLGGHAQTGVNVSLLPGARVGAYSWVYPGLVLRGDVPDCSFAKPGAGGSVELEPLRLDCPPWLLRKSSKQ